MPVALTTLGERDVTLRVSHTAITMRAIPVGTAGPAVGAGGGSTLQSITLAGLVALADAGELVETSEYIVTDLDMTATATSTTTYYFDGVLQLGELDPIPTGYVGAIVRPATDGGDFDAAGTAAGLVDDLSGVSDQATARTNLGLGTAATAATGDFAATSHTHTGTQVTVDASGFNGNLTTSDDTVQEIAQKLDDLTIPAAGIADPGGSNDDLLQRKSGAWTYRTPAQVRTDMKAVQSSDSSVLDIVSITRSAYNALSPPVATTLYVVTP